MTVPNTTEIPIECDDYEIPGWEIGPDGFSLYVRVRSAWLYIHVLEENFHNSPLALENLHANKQRFGTSCRTDEEALWDYQHDTASHFLPALRKLAPDVHHVGKLTLADVHVRQYYTCLLEYNNEKLCPGAIGPMESEEKEEEEEEEELHPDFEISNTTCTPFISAFPRFSASEIEVPYEDATTVFDIIPDKVYVDGQTLFWKPAWLSPESASAVMKYRKIQKSGIPTNELSTSRLYGIVVNSKGRLSGQLYYWIDIDKILTWDVVEQASEDLKDKWVSQIRNTIATLHRLDVIWGDVKAANVVIDKSGNAIVIDFEGGATKGWVDEDKMGTKEGDLQGLERLMEYITSDHCQLRSEEKRWNLQFDSDEVVINI